MGTTVLSCFNQPPGGEESSAADPAGRGASVRIRTSSPSSTCSPKSWLAGAEIVLELLFDREQGFRRDPNDGKSSETSVDRYATYSKRSRASLLSS